MKKLYLFACISSCCLALHSCKDEYTLCNLVKDVRFTGGFYRKVGSNDAVAPAPKFTLSELNSGSNIYNQQVNVEVFSLPLSQVIDSAKYVLKLDANLQADTVTIKYTSQGVNLSLECGGVTYNTITSISTTINTLDSIKIIRALVNTEPVQNVKIYY